MNNDSISLIDIIDPTIVELIQLGFNSKTQIEFDTHPELSVAMTIVGKNNENFYRIPKGGLPQWTSFCKYIREFKNQYGICPGDELCKQCDNNKAKEYLEQKENEIKWYTCHAGLQDLAIPIKVADKIVAVLFGGQRRLKNDINYENEAKLKIDELLKKIPELDRNILYDKFMETPEITIIEAEVISNKLAEVAIHISDLARRNYEARSAIKMMTKFPGDFLKSKMSLNEIVQIFLEEMYQFISTQYIIVIRINHKNEIISFPKINVHKNSIKLDLLNKIDEMISHNPIGESLYLDNKNDLELIKVLNEMFDEMIITSMFINPVHFSWGGHGFFFYINPKLDELEISNGNIMKKRREFIHDISERIKSLIDIIDLYSEKDELIAEVTHRLKSPMQWLLTEATTLPPRFESLRKWLDIDPSIIESLHNIENIVNFLDTQTRNYIIVSTMDKEEIQYDLKMHPFGRLIEICVEQFRDLAEEREIRLISNVDSNCFGRSLFDWDQIQVIIHNLIDNAIKYSHSKHSVRIHCRLDELNNLYTVRVDSFGVGIAPEEYESIFNKFSRGKIMKDPRRFIPGTGIGLTVAKKIANDHGGDVKLVECRQGEGAANVGYIEEGWKVVFEFKLPFNIKEE